MPAKSRRNRRNISQIQRPAANQPVSNSVSGTRPETARPDKTVSSFSPPKAALAPDITYPYVISEIKWIGVVTAIIAVILVVLYIFLQ